MIELKNVFKTYKSKKSKNTTAINGISFAFEGKGMTFILGKSGSGKSTLLNVIGGLDKYDKGDILILGKSSEEFKAADLDSYRNTYVGFIFQEFNLLEDYDVYENIILALQLQQKEINESEVDKLLERLELTDLKTRKVNELSGGQKQRVAIARALIKNPKIILADEPTGNLDSKTGRQVMELLKEISKEKLVVVVSHDEEYAKTYGDRIIEIKDGKVINDTKPKVKNETASTYQIIKSKLPFKESFKLGLGSIKHKKVKLVFTILLTVATLGFLSCTDTLSSYDYNKSHTKLLTDNKEQFVEIEKYYVYKEKKDLELKEKVELNENDTKEITKIANKNGYDTYSFYKEFDYGPSSINSILHIKNDNNYTEGELEAGIVKTDNINKIIKEKIIGREPTNSNEIVISNYVADSIIRNGIEVYEKVVQNEFKESNTFEPKTYEDILNNKYTYYFGDIGKVKIVGIIDYDLKEKFNSYHKQNVYNKIYVNNDFIDNLKIKSLENLKEYYELETNINTLRTSPNNDSYTSNLILDHSLTYYDGSKWKTVKSLNKNEVVVNIYDLVDSEKYNEELNNYVNKNMINTDYNTLSNKFFVNYVKELNVIGKKINAKVNFSIYFDKKQVIEEFKDLVIVGVYDNDNLGYGLANYFSNELLKNYRREQIEKTSLLYPISKEKDFLTILNNFKDYDNLKVKTSFSARLDNEFSLFEAIKTLATYASVVFLIFNIFLIMNFMFTSISYRKKEIGVLRALGARSIDVIKIFLWEAVVLSLISGTVASILLVVVSNLMNGFIKSQMDILLTPFLVGIRQFVVIYLLVFIVTFVSSILPLIKISKMKPIDAILNK